MSVLVRLALLLCMALFSVLSAQPVKAGTASFFYAPDDGKGSLICNGVNQGTKIPTLCSFDIRGELIISREHWDGNAIILEQEHAEPQFTGACAGSVIPNELLLHTYNLTPDCTKGQFPVPPDGIPTANFFYDPTDDGGLLSCNEIQKDDQIPNQCWFDENNEVSISREGWQASALIRADEGKQPIVQGACAGSVNVSPAPEYNYHLSPVCIAGPFPERQDATGTVLLDEWFTDLPWHQKLSTKDSNLIETPFVLPFAALPKGQCPDADTDVKKARCMLRYGIVNVMGFHRIDTLYAQGESSTPEYCKDDDCVEVKLKIQRFHTLTDNADGYAADIVKNNNYKHTRLPGEVPSLGFAITEATIFAPQRSWYTGHYCAADQDNIADSSCYEDYFTTQLVAPADTNANQAWLRDYPAVISPGGSSGIFYKFCKENLDHCTMYLGKVDWKKNATQTKILKCKSGDIAVCEKEVAENAASLDRQFKASLKKFKDIGRYPWDNPGIDLTAEINNNPYIGYYDWVEDVPGRHIETRVVDGKLEPAMRIPSLFKASHYVLPKKCTKYNYYQARHGSPGTPKGKQLKAIGKLEGCVLNFEVHTSGFHEQWKELWGGDVNNINVEEISQSFVGVDANQYGRTMFMLAGLREQHIPVSFRILDDGMSIYDKVYNSSLYTQYIPMVNPAEQVLNTKSYDDPFWHAFFMSNHMNQTPDHFIRGIRGRTLWHNEYRSNFMYESAVQAEVSPGTTPRIKGTKFEKILDHVDFPAGFQVADATAEFHGNTCDSCHIRNGGGVPLMPNGKLAKIHTDRGMLADYQVSLDYTYSNKVLPSMKMVLFDLRQDEASINYAQLLNKNERQNLLSIPLPLYNNRIMNFFGNSLHVNQKDQYPTYSMQYVAVKEADGFELVATNRLAQYVPKRVAINPGSIDTGKTCTGVANKPKDVPTGVWPRNCDDVTGADIELAIESHDIGYMQLVGRRLGNTPMIEMVPDKIMLQAELDQAERFGNIELAGDVQLVPGTRVGQSGESNYRSCSSGNYGEGETDCYLARWGWIGNRASLEDQVANAAIVEMGISSISGYLSLHPDASDEDQLVRYSQSLCGPANIDCLLDKENSDITEQEIRDMATYQRWIGIPNRSEFQVASKIVQQGEKIFETLECHSCHLIDKIVFDEDDNMLPDEERKKLKALQIKSAGAPEYPFISYLGTDLLLHDMGYLSQVAAAPVGVDIRRKDDGVIKEKYAGYIRLIRTPALKGLRFNRFVTDAYKNTTAPLGKKGVKDVIEGCDFLLHDGRACDAIEAAFLHDGPAINALGTIEKLNKMEAAELKKLRAFLYSL
ncbi:MAG: hypothetical protein L3J22_04135 [Xanthomonadales bacterium]|nr:hypothetical protein [Xanthomonadales bacterium]